MSFGTLFIVATPIGNLDDITLRAISTLQTVDWIGAEDTRHSKKLLQHFSINTPVFAVHDHNEKQRAQAVIQRLLDGQNIALISDAGTPLISDPGYQLVNNCREQGIKVVPIPGASAVITAICASGLPSHQFNFRGFLPVKAAAKQRVLDSLTEEVATSVFFESPRRLHATLQDIQRCFPTRIIAVAKELTKQFEYFVYGTASDAIAQFGEQDSRYKGEFVVMIAGAVIKDVQIPPAALNLLADLQAELPLKKAAAIVAKHYDLKKNQLYQIGLAAGTDAS